MITLECLLEFETNENRDTVLDLMRRFSSAMRYAYKRLLESEKRKDLKKNISRLFNINTRYSDNAILLAKQTIEIYKSHNKNPKKVIFGSRALFDKLNKKHLTGKSRKSLIKKWREKRQGNLYSRGDKSKQGNLNLRLQWINDKLYLRINIGDRQYVYAKVIRTVNRKNDKWIDFMFMLLKAKESGSWFPYSVRLTLKNGNVYAFISVEEKLPPVAIKKDNGVIGIDINAYPFHLALATASKDGNLENYQAISLYELLDVSSEKRQYLEWQIAHQIIEIAKKENKAIAIENLDKLPKGKRGDGFAKLRQKLQKWIYKRLLNKIEITARRNGIEIRKVNPAYTSLIGKLKYAPQFNIDKDIAAAFVIARRGLGYKEKLPKNYKGLLNDKDFLLFSEASIEDKIAKLKKEMKEEKNQYKRNKLKSKLSKLRKELKALEKHLSFVIESEKSKSVSQQPVNQRKEQVRGLPIGRYKNWQILFTAFTFSCLESYRDFSPLKRVMISRDWVRMANRLVPVLGAGTMTLPKYRLLGLEVSEMAEYKYPNPNCAEQ
ncbi:MULTISPECIES: IS200/IS605 family accessory protein TnpB-related protein [unclassified Hydrogenobaculum]|uniref:IS200/IS605 family accessory protein TnpB-related protein n=1 Tax=unclassified Hydrogenobaculum TaxID=2622382 RepID=UPI00020CCE3E|nr:MULTISPECIES: IS200/IS605 family accessory protein TnpB-related protein [unclassified Hydrogenobaculum]AEF18582.1 transposase [Hydrogenobaculum sp. 3684]AEG45870.1 transposase [Hydrogenobaculum sp. SHO]AGG14513.1 transposase [Hydrogenobaculum sp. HO]AGH92814.1 transposase, IS605 OrfB family, central region [Hydrogenobaculum sp. SN]